MSHTTPNVFAVLTAAGSGTRLGEHMPKALVPLNTAPMLTHAAHGLIQAGVNGIVVTAPDTHIADCERALHLAKQATENLATTPFEEKRTPPLATAVVPGGATRQASVAAGLAAIPDLAKKLGHTLSDETVILIHDAARALTPPQMIERVIAAVAAGSQAVIPVLPVADTLKVINRDHANDTSIGSVAHTVDRSTLMAVQTPQAFPWTVITDAHQRYANLSADESLAATDDAGLIEALGGQVDMVTGDSLAMKITTPWDLRIARLLDASAGQADNHTR